MPGVNILEDFDYDITDDEERILASLRYMDGSC